MQKNVKLVSVLCALCMLITSMPMRIMAEEETFSLPVPAIPQRDIVWNKTGVSLNSNFMVTLNTNGTVDAFATSSNTKLNDCFAIEEFEGEIATENEIIDVSVPPSAKFVAALKNDGSVYVTSLSTNNYGQTATDEWEDIVQISANDYHVVGLKSDGTVISTTPSSYYSGQDIVGGWTDIVKVVAGKYMTFGLKSDGTVVVTECTNSSQKYAHSEVEDWTDIVDIATSDIFTVGLKKDGTVIATSCNANFAYNAEKNWTDIVNISAYTISSSFGYVVGVKADGSVLITTQNSPYATNNNDLFTQTFESFKDIKKVYAHSDYIIGVKNDSTLVYATNSTAKNTQLASVLNDVCLEKTVPPALEYRYEDSGEGVSCYADWVISDEYTDLDEYNYRIYYTENLDKNPFDIENPDENLYSDSIKITKETSYNVVLVKQNAADTAKMYPSNILSVTAEAVNEKDGGFLPTIRAVKCNEDNEITEPAEFVEPGIVNPKINSISFIPKAYFGGEEIDCYDIYWKDASKINENYSLFTGNCKTFDNDIEILIYAQLKGEETKTEELSFKYIFLNEMPHKYPKAVYEPSYTLEEQAVLDSGNMLPRRNIMKVATGSAFTLALNTNGIVDGSYNSNITSSSSAFGKIMRGSSHFNHANVSNASGDQANVLPTSFDDTYDWNCVGSWRMMSDIAVGAEHVVGLRLDGTVITNGDNTYGQCDTSSWTDIVAVAAGSYHTVGLKKDGTVVATGRNEQMQCDVSVWNYSEDDTEEVKNNKKIVAISANNLYTMGLRKDGTVVATSGAGFGEGSTSSWTDIVDISAGTTTAAGLKNDGTVVLVGEKAEAFKEAENWKNITQISVGTDYILALDFEGKLLHAGTSPYGDFGAIYYYNGEKMDTAVKNTSFVSNGELKDPIAIFDYLEHMRFSTIAAGTCQFIAVTKSGVPYTVIHNIAMEGSTDNKYPMVAAFSLDNGPTFINNCPSATYNRDLVIDFSSTSTGYKYTYTMEANSNPATDGGALFNGAFDMMGNVLTVYTVSENTLEGYNIIRYYYDFANPQITALPEPGNQNGPVDVTLKSSLRDYEIYYTTDGTEPPKSISSTTTTTAQKYTGAISIDESTYIRARAYTSDGKVSTDVFNMYYSIPTEPIEGNEGTVVDYTNIPKGVTKVWTAKSSPYILNSGLTISSGGSLVIEPGVVVKIAKNQAINVSGSLSATGTEEDKLVFTALSVGDKWSGINLSPSTVDIDSVEFRNIELSGANSGIVVSKEKSFFSGDFTGLYIHDNTTGLSLNNTAASEFNITDCRFEANTTGLALKSTKNVVDNCIFDKNATAISISVSDNTVKNSDITNSTTVGVLNTNASGTKVNNCNLKANVLSVQATSSSAVDYVLDFTNNDWGNITEGIIRNRIKDKLSNTNYPSVDITGFKSVLTGFNAKCEFDPVLYTNNTTTALTLGNASASKTLYMTAAKISSADTQPMMFTVAMYDADGALVKVGTAVQNLPETSSDIVSLAMTNVTSNEVSTIAKIKIFVFSSDGNIQPYAESFTIE